MSYKLVALGTHNLPRLSLESVADEQEFVIEVLYGSICITWRCM